MNSSVCPSGASDWSHDGEFFNSSAEPEHWTPVCFHGDLHVCLINDESEKSMVAFNELRLWNSARPYSLLQLLWERFNHFVILDFRFKQITFYKHFLFWKPVYGGWKSSTYSKETKQYKTKTKKDPQTTVMFLGDTKKWWTCGARMCGKETKFFIFLFISN